MLHGEAEAVGAKLLVRLAAAVELLDVTAVALEHGVGLAAWREAAAARGSKSSPLRKRSPLRARHRRRRPG